MTPDEYCQAKAAASGSSFYYSFLFLPAERRRAITALYAFCREVDDAVDEASEPQLAAAKLAWWRSEVANLHAGKAQHPVTRALDPFTQKFSITAGRLNQIIDGMEMDLTQTRYLDWPGLERYCYLVAGVVGLLAAGIFGYRNERTLDYARHLGIAFQLTNVIRDVGEDARKNRIYVPMDELARFDVPASDILHFRESAQFRSLMAFQAERARHHYEQAMQALPAEDRRAQRSGLIMAAIYRTLLEEIEGDGFRVLTQKTSLTPLRKFYIAWKTWLAG
jgi:15-cis-phytoene synthase